MRRLTFVLALLLLLPGAAAAATRFDQCMATPSCKASVDAYAQKKVDAAVATQQAADQAIIDGLTQKLATCTSALSACTTPSCPVCPTCPAPTTCPAPPPPSPSALLYTTARLSWTNNCPDCLQFRVYCDESPSPATWKYSTIVTAPTTSTLVSALLPGPGTYTCAVDAETLDLKSPLSAPLTFAVVAGTAGLPLPGASIWPDSATPAEISRPDSQAVELGVKFRADVAGVITGVRFYKGPLNIGPHTAKLWTTDGTLLASAAVTNETASGWQEVAFATPITIAANSTYIASYVTASGFYSVTFPYFTSSTASGHLRALADGEDGGNGVYHYGGGFPSATFQSANYWVDVLFAPAP